MDRTENALALLSDPAGRRFAAEFVLVAIGIAALTTAALALIADLLPSLFATTGVDYGRYDWPDTRLESAHLIVGTTLLGLYFYWRLFFTALGERVRALAEEEML